MSAPLSGTLAALLNQWGIHPADNNQRVEESIKEALEPNLTKEQIGHLRVSVRWDQVTIEAPADTYPLLAWQKDQLQAIAETASQGTIVHMRLRRRTS